MEWVMKMSRFQINEEEYKAINKAEKRTKDKRISQLLRIVMMRYEGKKVREIAEITGYKINSISRICSRYRKEGLEGFVRNKYTSHRRLLTEAQEREILSRFEEAAEAGQEVTAQAIKAAFDEALGRDTGNSYIYVLLKRHKWRKVKPRPRHPKAADEEACEASKKLKPVCWIPEKRCSRTRKYD
jgi:transposase